MSKIKKISKKDFGFSFIPEAFLYADQDEFTIRNIQTNYNPSDWRNLSKEEVLLLEKNNNKAYDWETVLVQDPFFPHLIQNSVFSGLVRIGRQEEVYLQYHDFSLPVGITNSRIISCDIGENCAIHNCAYLSHYILGNSVILSCIDEMSTSSHAKFGEGVIKEGESEDVRIWLSPINEAGGRLVLPFKEMICADAYLWAMYRDDAVLMERLKSITQQKIDPRRGYYGQVGDETIIKSTRIIKDVNFGQACYVKGANKLKNLSIHSTRSESSQIGEGVELVNGIIGYGCRIFYGVKAVRFVLGNNSNLKYGARLIHSILGDNSTISCCEVLNNLVFPGHEQHHNNSFLIATMIMGQSNMAAGATVGSNHNTRGNDGEIIAGRGFWPGLSSNLKHNCRFASYVLLSKGNYPYELHIPFPFSLVIDNEKDNCLQIMPAYYWMYNMFALERNSWKYKNRDTRKTIVQEIEYDYLAPDTVYEILEAIEKLEYLTGKAWFIREGMDPVCINNEDCINKGKFLLENETAVVNSLSIVPEKIENSKRLVVLLRVAESYKAYKEMLVFYGVKTLAYFLKESNLTWNQFSERQKKGDLHWLNLGGQLVPEKEVDALREKIREKKVNSWEEIHEQYAIWHKDYPQKKAENAYQVLQLLSMEEKIEEKTWESFLGEAIKIAKKVHEQVIYTKQKDYNNYFRTITYRNKKEQNIVLGEIEKNPFILQAEKERDSFVYLCKDFLYKTEDIG
jgi:NDP-sugar pyrophosphorylase family protein